MRTGNTKGTPATRVGRLPDANDTRTCHSPGPMVRILASSLLVVLAASGAGAVTLSLKSETKPWPGVTIRKYRTASPATNARVAIIDLCAAGVHVEATQHPSGTKTTGAWGTATGVEVATNGDFYASPPLHVYGAAVGDGVPWSSTANGFDPRYAGEWFYEDYGWLAFLSDRVEYNHTKWVKKNRTGLHGWKPATVTHELPPGTLSLVSGFPELVTEGTVYTCASATASTCFPDRSDMRARHPRTAMGIDQSGRKFILLVVDGRTSTSAGMYGVELASTMKQLGAWQAFNLDGGGSSQMWQKGVGYLNDYNGNNTGNGARALTNHWGVFAGTGTGKPTRPGHCATSTPCQVIPAAGGIVDNTSACFRAFGPASGWRKQASGYGGSLVWTNAMAASRPGNWAWWRLHLAQAGDYRVEYYAQSGYAVFDRTRYEIVANGVARTVNVNQSRGSGWTPIGTYHFAAGGNQYVRLFDNASAPVASGKHIAADAIRLVPAASGCGDGTCTAPETCSTCAGDCGACPRCGDATCAGAETCATCPADCGSCCGNEECDEGETCSTCAADCGECPRCGDGACNGTEACGTCAADCGPCCGDGACDEGETCAACAADCGPCTRCGDASCNGDETCETCAADCGACASCGDHTCDEGESCTTCPGDCGACATCGDHTCLGDETCTTCPGDCGACATCGDGTCAEDEMCATCPADCGACASCGDGTCDPAETCATCASDCDACPSCGNATCDPGESCDNCPRDCACAACGDATCDEDESCAICPDDCGACRECGDGTCAAEETCVTCPKDCGSCACGDGTCGEGETCTTCTQDCGPCAPVPEPTGCACGEIPPLGGLLLFGLIARRARR